MTNNRFLHLTAKQYRSYIQPTQSKYHAQKTTVNNTIYDSKKEAKRAIYLENMEHLGLIYNLQKQVKFELQPAYVNNKGEKIKPISYVADFVYIQDGKTIVEDVKGMRTEVFKLKKKMFEYKYPEYNLIET